MTPKQFEVVAELANVPEGPERNAAHLVLLERHRPHHAAAAVGLNVEAVIATVARLKTAQETARLATRRAA